METKNSIAHMGSMLKPFWWRSAVLCILTVLSSVLQVISALLMRDVVDATLSEPSELLRCGVLLGIDLLAIVVLYAVSSWITGSSTDLCVAHLRRELLDRTVAGEPEELYSYHTGTLMSRGMEDVRAVCDGILHALPSMVGQLTRLVVSFGVVLLLYPSVAAYIALAAFVVAIVVAFLRPVLKQHHQKVRQADEKVFSSMQEDLQRLELVKSLGAEKQILSRFDEKLRDSLAAKRMRRILTVGSNTVLSAAAQLATAVMLLWGANQVAAGTVSYGSLTAMLQLLAMIRGPVLGLSGHWTRFTAVEVSTQRLEELLVSSDRQAETVGSVQIREIVFDHVTFAYPGDEEPVLEDYSAVLPLDQWLCLSGVSGRGKSTLFKLILGLYQPQKGHVYVKTADSMICCGPEVRHLFAYVPQDYALFSGSILDNLLLAAPNSNQAERTEALRLAGADFVLGLPEGENTLLRENNDGLSKGQLQRIAVARAILMDRSVFLLDECTSALDAESEQIVLRNLHGLGKQAILVTHRPEALQTLSHVRMISMEEM